MATLALGFPAAYGLSRFPLWRKDAILFDILSLKMIPPIASAVPLFILARQVGLYNTHLVLILLNTAFQLPFALLVLKSFIDEIPREIDEAARIDGCGPLAVMWHAVLPLAIPGLVCCALFVFIFTWNEFLLANVMVSGAQRPLPPIVGLALTHRGILWGPALALGVVVIAPVLALSLMLSRYHGARPDLRSGQGMSEEARIAALPLWHGRPVIEPVAAGRTNRNFIVQDQGQRYFARVGAEIPAARHLARGGAALRRCWRPTRASRRLSIFADGGIMITAFVEGETLSIANGADAGRCPGSPPCCKRLHAIPAQHDLPALLPGRRLSSLSRPAIRRRVCRCARTRIGAVPGAPAAAWPTQCLIHGDLIPENFIQSGERAAAGRLGICRQRRRRRPTWRW